MALILIKIGRTQAVVLPKETMSGRKEFRMHLKELATRPGVMYTEEADWKWR